MSKLQMKSVTNKVSREDIEDTLSHEERVNWMIKWAHKNKVVLDLEGECGFGRECVGITTNGSFPDYHWHDDETWERIDNNGDVWVPDGAYHKHDCVAVLGRGVEAETQLYYWLKWFDVNGFVVETGTVTRDKQFDPIELILGKHMYARMVKK